MAQVNWFSGTVTFKTTSIIPITTKLYDAAEGVEIISPSSNSIGCRISPSTAFTLPTSTATEAAGSIELLPGDSLRVSVSRPDRIFVLPYTTTVLVLDYFLEGTTRP